MIQMVEMDSKGIEDWSNMFKNCTSLKSMDFGEYYIFDDIKITHKELLILKKGLPGFKFSGKDIPRLRKILDTHLKKFYPEVLL